MKNAIFIVLSKKNMIWRDYLSCYVLRLVENFAERLNILEFSLKIGKISNIFLNFGKLRVIIPKVGIPHICHFFTHAKFLENKIDTENYTVNCQFFALNL